MLLTGSQHSQFSLLWGSNPAWTAEVAVGRRVRRDGLGSAGFMVDIISKVFSSLKWSCDSLAVPCPGSGLAAPDTHFPKQELSHSACGGSAPRGLPLVGFGTGTCENRLVTLTHQSCRGAQQGDKCSAQHREAKAEDVEGKKNINIFYLEE